MMFFRKKKYEYTFADNYSFVCTKMSVRELKSEKTAHGRLISVVRIK